MIEALPIGPDGIHRAAEEMIAEHGPEALAKARKRAQTVRSEGFESLAKTWDVGSPSDNGAPGQSGWLAGGFFFYRSR